MNVEIVDRLIENDPSLESSRSALEAMKEGAFCIHRAWGVGRISGYESDRGMLLIDFEEGDILKIKRQYDINIDLFGFSNFSMNIEVII